MPTRAAMLFDDVADGPPLPRGPLADSHPGTALALLSALALMQAVTEVRSSTAAQDGWAWWLATYRPDIVVSVAQGPDALIAAVYRMLFRRTRLVVHLRASSRPDNALRHALCGFVLRQADAVLAEDAAGGTETGPARPGPRPRAGTPVIPLSGPSGLDAFLACPLPRAPGSVHRIIYAGPLTPRSGATDILSCITAWARQHRDHQIEIWWAGEGDLAGILDAQPLPDGMSQRFLGPLDRAGLAECFARCGILVLPVDGGSLDPGGAAPVAEALAAGLVVVGSQADHQVRRYVGEGVNGWTFDPARFDQLGRAIAHALGAVSDDLAAMRIANRDRVQRLAAQTHAERLHAVLSLVLPGSGTASHRPGRSTLQPQAVRTGMAGSP